MATSATGRRFDIPPWRPAIRQILAGIPKFADIRANGLSG
jgi:hypothetical protein